MILLLVILISIIIIKLVFSSSKAQKKNRNFFSLKKRLLSKESNIERIFLRNDEKLSSDPDINLCIGLYENEESTLKKANIHRARLAKFKKSKLNGEMIYIDKEERIFKIVKGKKLYIN